VCMANLRRYDDRETLERIKRWPGLLIRFRRVRIYSAEHGAFWRGMAKIRSEFQRRMGRRRNNGKVGGQ
jgi:hypothetical protein